MPQIAPMDMIAVPHDPGWKDAFAAEAEAIGVALGDLVIASHHIGGTAIPGILAKPIIDILCVAQSLEGLDSADARLRALGFEPKGEHGIENRRFFRKTAANGGRAAHLHAFEPGSPHIERHLAFRDYLLRHPEKAAAYSDLKRDLMQGGATTAEAYAAGKAPFVLSTEREALDWYRRLRPAPEGLAIRTARE